VIRGLHAAALACAAALALSGCGGGEPTASAEASLETDQPSGAAADTSVCHDDESAAPSPAGDAFPGEWPFPPETVVYDVEDRSGTGVIVTGVSSAEFSTILDFMNHDVVGAGFEQEGGETEEHDAEGEWSGNGFRGRWAIRESTECPGDTVIQVVAAPLK
jgi:hypothetical protein